MPFPYLAFCPYLAVNEPVEFGDWELGPLAAFEERWADLKFKTQAKAFLAKFIDGGGQPIEHPSLLCRRKDRIDGILPSPHEIEALEAAIAFAFLDTNPRCTSSNRQQHVITADNTELFIWPIDVDAGYVTVTTGIMVRTVIGGYRIGDENLTIRPPLDLPRFIDSCTVDPMCLEAVYQTVWQSLQTPEADFTADRLKAAIGWFVKTWRNTATVTFPDRVVFLKTAFEALSGKSESHLNARFLRKLFEAIPRTARLDLTRLVWSPAERPVHTHTAKNGKTYPPITDLEKWFMAFAEARNEIIHEGKSPPLEYSGSNAAYDGHFVFTAEFLLRAAIKVRLSSHGYPDLLPSRSDLLRTIQRAVEEHEARARVVQQEHPGA